jgi:hypothetical protein
MFRIGQKVTPKRDVTNETGMPAPSVGEVVTVTKTFRTKCGNPQIEIAEYPSPGTDEVYPGFNARAFEIVVEKKTDISVFEEILRRETVDDRAPAVLGIQQR